MSFGGTPRCERCGGAVYHAEQVIGPGRKIYHKLCLKCNSCGKRLDPGGLVQHDEQANLYRDTPAAPPPPPAPVAEPAFSSPSRRDANGAPAPRAVPPPQEYYVPPDLSGSGGGGAASSSSSSSAPVAPAPPALPARPSTPEQITRVNFRSVRPIPSGVSASGRTDSPRSKVGERPGFEDRCPACEKRVYAAEQVQAIGKKWHRGCLRCTSCRSTIDPSKVSDRDGQPWCKNCYAREHGPGGIAGKR
ncbi:Cysteine-rich protein 2 [Vanrija pseudolonga]|uniref:Cysteine-rich protein 2 n=1 Tax=Vanrija pseudolonga TaxID=143232 RepID=A0AAF1BIS1_9TREE|nr:Cysteine-rich protein 2 [Vanrija pseudolonga]